MKALIDYALGNEYVGMALLSLGGFICVGNIWWCYCVPFWRMKIRKSDPGFVPSVTPLFGSALVGASLYWGWDVPIWLWSGIFLILIDIGGIHWAVFMILTHEVRERSKER